MKTGWAILVACISSLAISGCSGGEEEAPADDGKKFVPSVPPVDGAASFVILAGADASPGPAATPAKWSTCTSCHQGAGQGFMGIAPEVRHIPVDFATNVIRNGRKDSKGMQTGMLAFPLANPPPGSTALTDAEVTEIVTWLNQHPKPTTGEALYKDFCGNCHGPATAAGGSSGKQILAGVPASKVDAAVRGGFGSDPNLRQFYMPKFDATLLTDAELGLIKQFLGAK